VSNSPAKGNLVIRENDMTTMTLNYSPTGGGYPGTALARAIALGGLWLQRARQRRQLSQLADWQLDDIGISRNAAQTEAAKAFWRE